MYETQRYNLHAMVYTLAATYTYTDTKSKIRYLIYIYHIDKILPVPKGLQ